MPNGLGRRHGRCVAIRHGHRTNRAGCLRLWSRRPRRRISATAPPAVPAPSALERAPFVGTGRIVQYIPIGILSTWSGAEWGLGLNPTCGPNAIRAQRSAMLHRVGRTVAQAGEPSSAVPMTVVSMTPPTIGCTIQQVTRNVVDVDLDPAGPRRGWVAGKLADTNIGKSPHRTFAPHLISEEFGPRTHAHLKIKCKRLALARTFRIERRFILRLKAVEHADNRLLDDEPQIDRFLICLCHVSS